MSATNGAVNAEVPVVDQSTREVAIPVAAAGDALQTVHSGVPLIPVAAAGDALQTVHSGVPLVTLSAAAVTTNSEGDRGSASRHRRRSSKTAHQQGSRSRRGSKAAKDKRARSPAKEHDGRHPAVSGAHPGVHGRLA